MKRLIFALGILFFVTGVVGVLQAEDSADISSIEDGIATLSPAGVAGGYAIPASCSSFEHVPGECSGDVDLKIAYGNSSLSSAGYDLSDILSWFPGMTDSDIISIFFRSGQYSFLQLFNFVDGPHTFSNPGPNYGIVSFGDKSLTNCQAGGDWSGTKRSSGDGEFYLSVAPGTYTYTLTCTRPSDGVQLSDTAVVVVGSGAGNSPPPTADIKVNGSDTAFTIQSGTTATLTWTSSNAYACTVSEIEQSTGNTTGTTFMGLNNTIGQSVSPTVDVTYKLDCIGDFGADSDSVDVNVTGPICGNGSIETGEQCDSGNLGGETCSTLGYSGGTLGCVSAGQPNECTFDVTQCTNTGGGPTCGNGVKETGEECDGADLGGLSCASLGYSGGTLSCTSSCTFDYSQCTLPSSPAECDDGIDNDGDGFCDWSGGSCTDNSIVGDPGCQNQIDNNEENCGNGICEAYAGESPLSCPADCTQKGIKEQ